MHNIVAILVANRVVANRVVVRLIVAKLVALLVVVEADAEENLA